jgi:hypothetical protein
MMDCHRETGDSRQHQYPGVNQKERQEEVFEGASSPEGTLE